MSVGEIHVWRGQVPALQGRLGPGGETSAGWIGVLPFKPTGLNLLCIWWAQRKWWEQTIWTAMGAWTSRATPAATLRLNRAMCVDFEGKCVDCKNWGRLVQRRKTHTDKQAHIGLYVICHVTFMFILQSGSCPLVVYKIRNHCWNLELSRQFAATFVNRSLQNILSQALQEVTKCLIRESVYYWPVHSHAVVMLVLPWLSSCPRVWGWVSAIVLPMNYIAILQKKIMVLCFLWQERSLAHQHKEVQPLWPPFLYCFLR